MTIEDAFEDFLLACKADGLSPKTVRWYQSIVGMLVVTFEGVEVQKVTTKDLRQYLVNLENRGSRYVNSPQRPTQQGAMSKSSIAGHSRALHRFWRWTRC